MTYSIRAKLQTKPTGILNSIKRAFTDLRGELELHVIGTIPKQTIESHNKIQNFQNDKSFALSRSKGRLATFGSITTGVISPRDSIPVTVNVTNQSNKRVTGFVVKLVELIKLSAQGHHQHHKKTMAKQPHTFPTELKSKDSAENIVVTLLVPQNIPETCEGKIFKRTFRVFIFFFILFLKYLYFILD